MKSGPAASSAARQVADGSSAHTRTDGKHVYLFVGNYEDRQSDVLPLGKEMLDMLSGEMLSELSLPPFGFAVLKYGF